MNTKMQTKKAKRGFTITELVIVIAVIAILAAVLIPTFSNVIDRANESAAMQEARSEWSNYQPEVAATLDDDANNDFLIKYDDADDTSDTPKYFLAEDGQFDPNELTGVSITSGTNALTGVTGYGTAVQVTDYTSENENITIYKLTKSA